MPRRIATADTADAQLGEAAQINLTWLVYLRWAAVLGQALTILYTAIALTIELPFTALFAVLGVEVLSNVWLTHWHRRHPGTEAEVTDQVERVQVLVMFGDTLLLTTLLFLTGGVANPFSAFFFVHVVMAAVLLRQRWSYGGTAFACLCLLVLHFWHVPLPILENNPELRLQGMLIALSFAAVITVVFVARVTRALDLRNTQLATERDRKARTERVQALGTLAAGAAHELASPLSTIAIVAKELEKRLMGEDAPEDDVADARLLRDEVARCRRILHRMNLEAGDQVGEELVPLSVAQLLENTIQEVPGASRVDVAVGPAASEVELFVPAEGLAQALRAVVSNALDASGTGQRVQVGAHLDGDQLLIWVLDQGEGMDAELAERALDPFFTTKEPGRGMGLGLFLTRSVVERLGGELRIQSKRGEGTTVTAHMPLARLVRPV
ncbi:MAG: ATP-binding protein [Planctomycetota bacterium]|nr:ATP-binding protein [Planctomycetota bacterium]